jgi:hypothetical protein
MKRRAILPVLIQVNQKKKKRKKIENTKKTSRYREHIRQGGKPIRTVRSIRMDRNDFFPLAIHIETDIAKNYRGRLSRKI